MLQASENLKQALNSDTRYITPTVKLYFDGDNKPPRVLSDDDIVDLNILEEIANEVDNPIGNVCSNELTLELLNDNNIFTLTNTDSSLYGKILPGVKCEVSFNVYINETDYEVIKMGTYYLEDCQSSSTSMSAVITAYDRLYSMYELDAPDISVQHNITVKDLFRLFFNNLGLVEHKDYLIDETLSSTIKMAWFESGTVGDCIKSLSTSCACLVYVNRHNQIVVKDQLKLSSYDVVLSDNDQIYDIRNVPSYQEMRSVVELEYNIPSVDNSPTELLSITDLTLQPGLNEFKKLEFSKSPVALISGIQINKGSAVIITDYTINAHSIDITIQNNRGQEQTVDISIFGNVINSTKSSIIKKDLELLDVVGNRPLKLNSYLLQSNNTSQEYVDVLLSLVTNFGSNIEMEVRGNPLIEITDVINISAPSYNIVEKVIPIKVTYSMREGLSGTMLCVKSDSRSHSDTVFISPGLIVTSNR